MEERILRYTFLDILVLVIADRLVISQIIVSRSQLMLRVPMEVNKMVIGEVIIWLWDQVIKIYEKIVNKVYLKKVHR